MNGAPLAVAVRGLTKRFGSVVALDGLDLDVPAGSTVGLVGLAGSGKSTLLRMLAGLAWPSKGRVTVTEPGTDTPLRGADVRRRTGYVPEAPGLYDWMTGRELLQLVGSLVGHSADDLQARVDDTLATIGLEDEGDERIQTYGPAARQRLAFGQALIGRPDLLLLDEPLASPDPSARADVKRWIAAMRGTTTVLLATASLDDAAGLCDRLVVLDRGQVVAAGATEELTSLVAESEYVVDVDPGDEPGIVLLADALRRQAWVREVDIDGSQLRIRVGHPELAALRIAPMLGTSGLRIRSVRREPLTVEALLATVERSDVAERAAGPRGGTAAEAAR